MIMMILLFITTIIFLLCITIMTLSDTETFKAIDRKIANKIGKKEKTK